MYPESLFGIYVDPDISTKILGVKNSTYTPENTVVWVHATTSNVL